MLTLLTIVGCSSSSKQTKGEEKVVEKASSSETSEYPDFIPDADPPSFDPRELASNVEYPGEAVKKELEGKVYVMAYIAADGTVDKAEVMKSDNIVFNEAALGAVRKTTFSPARHQGVAIPFKLAVVVDFRLR